MPDPHRERQILIVLAVMTFTHVLDFMIMMPLAWCLIAVVSVWAAFKVRAVS